MICLVTLHDMPGHFASVKEINAIRAKHHGMPCGLLQRKNYRVQVALQRCGCAAKWPRYCRVKFALHKLPRCWCTIKSKLRCSLVFHCRAKATPETSQLHCRGKVACDMQQRVIRNLACCEQLTNALPDSHCSRQHLACCPNH